MAAVHSIVYQIDKSQHQESLKYNRIQAECVTLIAGHGINGDRKAGHNPRRQINIMSLETLQALANEGWRVGPGEMGEQMVISGLDVMALPERTRLKIGDSAVVEVFEPREPCDWLGQIQGKNHENVVGRAGVFVGVVTGGNVCVGDSVSVM
jgi:MOSC domain-containing protein YiiM